MMNILRMMILGTGLMAIAILGVGCDGATKSTTIAKTAEDVKKTVGNDLKKAGNIAKEGVSKGKESFENGIRELVGKADADIKALEDKANAKDTAADVKTSLLEKAAKAKELLTKIKNKLVDVMSADGEKWEMAKADLEKMVNDFKSYLTAK